MRRTAMAMGLGVLGVVMLTVTSAGARPATQVGGNQVSSAHAVPVAFPARSEWEIFPSRNEVVPTGRALIRLPILMYHYIQPPPPPSDVLGRDLSVTPEAFTAQLDWLAENGYHAVDFNDVRAYFEGRQSLPGKPFLITLDDGYRDLYTAAFPIIKAHHFKAVAYIVTGFLDQPRYVTQAQVQEMDANGIQIAAHTVSHVNLARTAGALVARQLLESKDVLEKLVSHPVIDFAYPSGQFNSDVVVAVRNAGYETAVTTQESSAHTLADRLTWGRVRVRGGESLEDFIKGLGPNEATTIVTTTAEDPAERVMRQVTLPMLLPDEGGLTQSGSATSRPGL